MQHPDIVPIPTPPPGDAALQLAHDLAEANAQLLRQKARIEAEAERRARAHAESESRFRAIFDQTFQFIGILDPTGRVLDINRTALDAIGVQLEDVRGLPFDEAPWWAASAEGRHRLRQAINVAAHGGFDRFEALHVLADGSTIVVDFSIKPMRDETGKVVMLIPEGRDITALKQLEAELRGQFDQLKALDDMKNNFVNAVTHELRTPLATIVGFSEFLQDELGGPLGPDQQTYVAEIIRAAGRLEHLLNDLLDFAQMDAGTFHLDSRHLDLRESLIEIVQSLRPQAAEHGVHLQLELPVQPLGVNGDPQRIAQILSNLLHNALKFAPRDTLVRVAATVSDGAVCCSVQDQGEGIPLSEQHKLFQRFQQLSAGVGKGKGTGLGLSISKALVEAHGGTIRADSAPGKGSTFSFTLPAAPAPLLLEDRSGDSLT